MVSFFICPFRNHTCANSSAFYVFVSFLPIFRFSLKVLECSAQLDVKIGGCWSLLNGLMATQANKENGRKRFDQILVGLKDVTENRTKKICIYGWRTKEISHLPRLSVCSVLKRKPLMLKKKKEKLFSRAFSVVIQRLYLSHNLNEYVSRFYILSRWMLWIICNWMEKFLKKISKVLRVRYRLSF